MDTARIEIEEYEPVPDKPGYCRVARRKTIKDVHRLLKAELASQIDEYFDVFPTLNPEEPFPKGRIACFAVTGANEGHYIHVEVIHRDTREATLLFLGKTFAGWDHAWKMTETCARLLGA